MNRNIAILVLFFAAPCCWDTHWIAPIRAAEDDRAMPTKAVGVTGLPGFRVERLYLVPRDQGSWVSMTFDDRGRMIVSHEGGGLYRVQPSPLNRPAKPTRVEKLNVKLGGAQGLLYAFDSLYAISGGVHRLRDTTGDGQFDEQTKLFDIRGRGEHGPHAIVLGPQKKWMYVIAGNATGLPSGITRDRVASRYQAKAHSPPGPQGWVMRLTPDGKRRELYAVGLRNSYGLAFNDAGDLFTFDSDNEGFMNLPWYRPTNIFHVVSGADYGWRQSAKNVQPYQLDNLPPTLEVGPGSPTGIVFGRGASFPVKYRQALFVSDWSYGRIYAIHMQPQGATYSGRPELFVSGRPLAVTDLRIGPDGAMYFLTGGRGTQSALYRVSHDKADGPQAEDPARQTNLRSIRVGLEDYHGRPDKAAVSTAWPNLRSRDRFVRYAARVAIEHQPSEQWIERAFSESNVTAAMEAMVAVVNQAPSNLRQRVLKKVLAVQWGRLSHSQRLSLLRVCELALERWGPPEQDTRVIMLKKFNGLYPNRDDDLNRELIKILIAVNAESLNERTIDVLEKTPSGMRQLHFLLELRKQNIPFSETQKQRLLTALDIDALRDTATRPYKDVAAMMKSLFEELNIKLDADGPQTPKKLVKEWTGKELERIISADSARPADVANGKAVFRKAQCHHCHRVGNTGGVLGPNLTSLAGRFQPRAVLEAIAEPDKVISDQYRTTVFRTTKGKTFTGQIVNLSRGVIQIRLDPLRPFPRVSFKESEIEEIRPSNVSLMPKGLLNYLNEHEIRDLMAYLLTPR